MYYAEIRIISPVIRISDAPERFVQTALGFFALWKEGERYER